MADRVAPTSPAAHRPGLSPRRAPVRRAPALPTWVAKAIMAVTGLVLAAFVVVHMIGNLKVFSGAALSTTRRGRLCSAHWSRPRASSGRSGWCWRHAWSRMWGVPSCWCVGPGHPRVRTAAVPGPG